MFANKTRLSIYEFDVNPSIALKVSNTIRVEKKELMKRCGEGVSQQ